MSLLSCFIGKRLKSNVNEFLNQIVDKPISLSKSGSIALDEKDEDIIGHGIWVKDTFNWKPQSIYGLRVKKGLSQDALARKVMVTRQAVSRWENGETVPNTETLKLLSKEFDVSINTLLGTPRKLICTYEADRTSPELVLYKKR